MGGLPDGGPSGPMSIIGWNCRGVGNVAIVRELKFAPSILGIVETQISKSQVEALASTLGFDSCVCCKQFCWRSGFVME